MVIRPRGSTVIINVITGVMNICHFIFMYFFKFIFYIYILSILYVQNSRTTLSAKQQTLLRLVDSNKKKFNLGNHLFVSANTNS